MSTMTPADWFALAACVFSAIGLITIAVLAGREKKEKAPPTFLEEREAAQKRPLNVYRLPDRPAGVGFPPKGSTSQADAIRRQDEGADLTVPFLVAATMSSDSGGSSSCDSSSSSDSGGGCDGGGGSD